MSDNATASMLIRDKHRITNTNGDEGELEYRVGLFRGMIKALMERHPVGTGKIISVDIRIKNEPYR